MTIFYTVYSADGTEAASYEVGSHQCGDEATAERDARAEAERLSKKFDSNYRVEREEA